MPPHTAAITSVSSSSKALYTRSLRSPPKPGRKNVGTSVCVKLAYSPSQFVHPLKLIALCVSYGQLHIFCLRFRPGKASFLFFVRDVYRAACTPRICPHGCPSLGLFAIGTAPPLYCVPAADCHGADIPRPCAEFSLRFDSLRFVRRLIASDLTASAFFFRSRFAFEYSFSPVCGRRRKNPRLPSPFGIIVTARPFVNRKSEIICGFYHLTAAPAWCII